MAEEFKIYTKGGDKGETSLIGGTRVPKFHPRIEAYGTVDELNSYIGLLSDHQMAEQHKELLEIIKERLFVLESILALDPEQEGKIALPQLQESDITLLELAIDGMNEKLPQLSNFILPGGHIAASFCHVARTVCRRAERNTIRLAQASIVDPIAIRYLNRLSDYLFVLARSITFEAGLDESIWKPVK